MKNRTSTPSAFSLVELSIVLVILGLLVGGVLAGQSLIRAAELRAISSESSRYRTATQSFRDKYFALPGDMSNAIAFWGTDAGGCPGSTVRTGKTETCNGNGNGLIDNCTPEMFRFWQQLANAGLIEGSYSGTGTTSTNCTHAIRENSPNSRMGGAGWQVRSLGVSVGNTEIFATNFGTANLDIGTPWVNGTNTFNAGAFLKPEEAWSVDTKMDDGLPGRGSVIARFWATCTTAAANTDVSAVYRLDQSAIACSLMFANAF